MLDDLKNSITYTLLPAVEGHPTHLFLRDFREGINEVALLKATRLARVVIFECGEGFFPVGHTLVSFDGVVLVEDQDYFIVQEFQMIRFTFLPTCAAVFTKAVFTLKVQKELTCLNG